MSLSDRMRCRAPLLPSTTLIMAESTRTFIAVEVPEAQREELARLRDRLAPELRGAKWVARTQYHATLAFLGDVSNPDLDAILGAVGEAARAVGPLELRLAVLGAFPNPGRPRNLWVGLDGAGLTGLERLHAALGRALSNAGQASGGRNDFSPHVTLARFKTGPGRPAAPDLRGLLPRYAGWSSEPFTIAEVVAFASELRPEGPVYTALARSALGGL